MYWTTGLYSITIDGIPSFQAANPAGGVPEGTELTYPWFNDVQGENLNVVFGTGLTPAPNTPTQVLQGIKRVAGGNFTTVAASGALTADNAGIVLVNAAAGNIALTLPAAASAGGVPLAFNIMRIDSVSANSVTISAAGSDTFQPSGVSSGTLGVGRDCDIVGDGTASWITIGRGRELAAPSAHTSSGSITSAPIGTNWWECLLLGGGAAGGGGVAVTGSNSSVGSPGSGGSWARILIPWNGTSIPFTIGGGGAGISGGNGSSGGTSTVAGIIVPGGLPGNASAAAGAPAGNGGSAPSGVSGSPTGGAILLGYGQGLAGGLSLALTTTSGFGGPGGASIFGGGTGFIGSESNGVSASTYGSGGSGTCNQNSNGAIAGGAGFPGVAYFTPKS